MHLPRIPHFFDQKNHINLQYRIKFKQQYIESGAKRSKNPNTQTWKLPFKLSTRSLIHSHTHFCGCCSIFSLVISHLPVKLWKLHTTRHKLSATSRWIYSNLNTHSFYIASRCKVWRYAFCVCVCVLLPYTVYILCMEIH